jgi:ABC-type phosphate transport system auxiliary subunit
MFILPEQQVESQIEALEVRMQRREKELMSAVEEAKAAAAVERSRLEALHAQVRHTVLLLRVACEKTVEIG